MRLFRSLCVVWILVGVALGQGARLHYTVEVKEGDDTAYRCKVDIRHPDRDLLRFSVAAWAPGSYRLLNQSQNIVNVKATAPDGAELPVSKEGDLTWMFSAGGRPHVTLSWDFKAPGKARNNRSYLTKTGALLDGPRTWLYWRDRKDLSAHVTVKVPNGWTVATGLESTFEPNVFVAKDTDWLLDCPILMGKLETRSFFVEGVPVRVAVEMGGRKPEFDMDAFTEVCRRITETQAKMWRGVPFDHYTYLFSGGGGGGLEHLTSTTIGISPSALATNPAAHQGVTAHELFHAWNVKRLRPKTLGPFDYDGPVRTKSLWISEGFTDYYTQVMLARAGLIDEAGFIDAFASSIMSFSQNEASRVLSPEETSWTVWDGPYLAGPLSYYQQGQVLGLAIDLEIRHRTKNAKSLDDAMRHLYDKFSGKQGFMSEDVVLGILESTGVDLHDFFLRHVSAAQEVDWPKHLAHMGVKAEYKTSTPPATALDAEVVEGAVKITVLDGSALHRSGLRTGDVLKEVGGTKVQSANAVRRLLAGMAVGAKVPFVVLRDGKEQTVSVVVEAATDLGRVRVRRGPSEAILEGIGEASPIHRAGLHSGDVLLAVNGTPIGGRDEARRVLAALRAGDAADIRVKRKDTEISVKLVAAQAAVRSLTIEPNPAATAEQIAIRRSLVRGS